MASIRQQKWDWAAHLPRMIELYNSQTSIPDIHKAIQCDGFEPCQRSVYLKFKQMGYPTDPVGRTKFLDSRYTSDVPAEVDTSSSVWMKAQSPPFDTNHFLDSGLHSPFNNSTFSDAGASWSHGYDMSTPSSEQFFESGDILGGTQLRDEQAVADNNFGDASAGISSLRTNLSPGLVFPSWLSNGNGLDVPTNTTDHAFQYPDQSMELNGASYFGIETDSGLPSSLPEQSSMQNLPALNPSSEYSRINTAQPRPLSPNPSLMDLDTNSAPFQFSAASSDSSNSVKLPFQKLIGASNTGARSKIRSLFRPKSSASNRGRKRYAVSQFTNSTEDSGYASGHASSLTLEEVRRINSQSLDEFNGLYRVACQVLHEPQAKSQCKDIPTCTSCHYSGIHNLGWSARYLKLEVFLSELRLEGVYNFGALDAAGNTALHYAAAGGASFLHLKALIDVGVDPYLANSAGELFIYCLRPLQPFTLEPNSDCLRGDDLIKLLGLLHLERVSDWRDNDGQTVMHALALKISEPDLKTKIFDILRYSGFSSTVLDRFGRSPEQVFPLTYDSHGQVIDPVPTNSLHQIKEVPEDSEENGEAMTCGAIIVAEFRLERIKQNKAQTVVVKARHQPSYIDTESGENVLHALSRIVSSSKVLSTIDHLRSNRSTQDRPNREGNYMLLNLEYFIAKGVDLNAHNREGSHPLKSFICDRPWDEHETGATMSKYLDMILWKDQSSRTKNKVNVDMKDREGLTALYHAAVRGRPDSVRSLIEAGANVNAYSIYDKSILHATYNALDDAVKQTDSVLVHLLREVISHLEHAGAVQNPTSLQERGTRKV
ncbi:hypothetical protein ONS95_002550 [Cadophora gregata]|uniref:uncharacterized protein n=1 Tax=Cadophora gregata TaxID=51156 RepID=UPI0026DBFDE6|nr:uncharacterized protein ONS95_002550 [Cadophora gregata]KAK0109879.1 hypothetical protein ONS95_002550 [Cadophora gregata]